MVLRMNLNIQKTILAISDKINMQYTHEHYMQRCIQLAEKGKANVKPNPMVGSVIVYNDTIIGEGYHQIYGEAHAEVNAINSVKDKSLLKESTLYVNLEPCAHHGKTPPCSDLIVEKQIKRVVIGCIDSFAKVAGKGIEKMQKAGIEVIVGILEKESLELNKAFFNFHTNKRPYIILKWAQTLDGFIDIKRKEDDAVGINWITHPSLKLIVHKWRSEETAILIGNGTLRNDNPKLDTREWYGKNPLRILLSKDKKISTDYKLLDGSTETLVFSNSEKLNIPKTTFIKLNNKENPIKQVLNELYSRDIQTLIVEGGRETLQSFIDNNLWNEARVLIGDKTFGEGLSAPIINKSHKENIRINKDTILFYKNN